MEESTVSLGAKKEANVIRMRIQAESQRGTRGKDSEQSRPLAGHIRERQAVGWHEEG